MWVTTFVGHGAFAKMVVAALTFAEFGKSGIQLPPATSHSELSPLDSYCCGKLADAEE
jgi:hypothetical protein